MASGDGALGLGADHVLHLRVCRRRSRMPEELERLSDAEPSAADPGIQRIGKTVQRHPERTPLSLAIVVHRPRRQWTQLVATAARECHATTVHLAFITAPPGFGGATESGGGYPRVSFQADALTERRMTRHEGSEGRGHAVSFRNRFSSRNVGR